MPFEGGLASAMSSPECVDHRRHCYDAKSGKNDRAYCICQFFAAGQRPYRIIKTAVRFWLVARHSMLSIFTTVSLAARSRQQAELTRVTDRSHCHPPKAVCNAKKSPSERRGQIANAKGKASGVRRGWRYLVSSKRNGSADLKASTPVECFP